MLDELDRLWIPVRRSWRLNERHYGDLQGKDKKQTVAEYGEEQVHEWRRSYDTPPPPIGDDNPYSQIGDARYADLPSDVLPLSECLLDVVDRMLPYWYDGIVPDLRAGHTVLVAAHGNSCGRWSSTSTASATTDIAELNLPTGVPFRYDLDADLRPARAQGPPRTRRGRRRGGPSRRGRRRRADRWGARRGRARRPATAPERAEDEPGA